MHKIKLTKLSGPYKLKKPNTAKAIDIDCPALTVFTDFHKVVPRMLEGSINLIEAKTLMIREHVKLKIVIDDKENMIGAVSFRDIESEKAIIAAKDKDGIKNVEVFDVMTPLEDLVSISFSELEKSSIKDVVSILQHEHKQHAFIVDEEKKQIIGILSASDIARKLCLPIVIQDSPTFNSIFKSSN